MTADGYIVTNNHVVQDAEVVEVTLSNNHEYKAEVIGKDPDTDIALIKVAGPGPFGQVLARHPRLRAVIAHLGAPEYEGFLDLAERYERVMLDTTMMFTDFFDRGSPYPRRALPRLRDLGLGGKVLLGSDFPNIPYPYAAQLAGLARLDFGDAWLRAVCWESAAALFKL